MSKVLFFFMGVPMMILSFFEATQVLPFVTEVTLYSDGQIVELSQDDQQGLFACVCDMFKDSRTMPALGVVTDEEFKDELQSGVFVSLKFDKILEINGLPFDELIFKIEKENSGFNLIRGLNGVYDGRCIYIHLGDKTMEEADSCVQNLLKEKTSVIEDVEVI